MKRLLGKISFSVYEVGPNGEIDVEYETFPNAVLHAMQATMTKQEGAALAAIRSEISRGVGIFFAQWKSPERTMDAEKR